MLRFEPAIEKFLKHLQTKARIVKNYSSPNTVRTYRGILQGLAHHLRAIGVEDLRSLRKEHILAYLEAARGRGISARTLNLYITVFQSFSKWRRGDGSEVSEFVDFSEGLERPRMELREAPFLTKQQVDNLLDYLYKCRKALKRDAILFELMARTGARVSEIAALDLDSVKADDERLEVSLLGKGNKRRVLITPIPPNGEEGSYELRRFVNRFQTYLSRYRRRWNAKEGHEKALFLTQYGNRIRPRNVQAAYSYYAQRLNLPGSPHSLRHFFCSHLLGKGVDVVIVSKLAGHASPRITLNVYAHADPKRLEEGLVKSFA